jgi:uncharacterized protein (TIGR03067 family)
MVRLLSLSLILFSLQTLFADPPQAADEQKKMAGLWLVDKAMLKNDSYLNRLWLSTFIVEGNQFRVSKVMQHPKDLTGTFKLDPSTSPPSIDFEVNELDFAPLGAPVKIPKSTIPGIYQWQGDFLTLCFPINGESKRPTEFKAGDRTLLLTLGRAKKGFIKLLEEIEVKVLMPDGKPAANASTFTSMSKGYNPKDKGWKYVSETKTNSEGISKMPYEKTAQGLTARLTDHYLIGFKFPSPYSLQSGSLTVQLEPEIWIKGKIASDDLKAAHISEIGGTTCSLMHQGNQIGGYVSTDGMFEFPVPAGDFVVSSYGEKFVNKHTSFTVPPGRSEFPLTLNLKGTPLVHLKGKPAPEFKDVLGWKGEKVSLADLKGKYVLLEFWGYWCGPCVASMPVLIELHDKFKDKGLAIVGIHVDIEGEIDTAAKLDEKLVDIRKKLWKDRDLPFPSLLSSGKRVADGDEMRRGGLPLTYGIMGYPTTVLIDREGKVVGKFNARKAAEAVKQMEKLLETK